MPRTVLLAADGRTGDFSAPYWPVESTGKAMSDDNDTTTTAMSADNDTTEDSRKVVIAKSDAENDAMKNQNGRIVTYTETPTVIVEEVEITVILR